MLVLPHADRLRVDFYKLRQRILQAARHRGRRALPDVKIREFLGGESARAVHGRAGLVHDDILDRLLLRILRRILPDQLRDDLFRFARCGAVAEGNQGHMVLFDQLFDRALRLVHAELRRGRIDHGSIQHPPGRIDDGDLAACAESRVPAQHNLPGNGRLHQQLFEVLAENDNRAVLRALRESCPQLPLDGRRDQPLIAVPHGLLQRRRGVRIGTLRMEYQSGLQILQNLFFRCIDFNGEEFLVFAAVDGENPMPRYFVQGLLEVKIHLIDSSPALQLFVLRCRRRSCLSDRRVCGLFPGSSCCRGSAMFRHRADEPCAAGFSRRGACCPRSACLTCGCGDCPARRLLLRGLDGAELPGFLPDPCAVFGVVRDLLGDDILGALQCLLRCADREFIRITASLIRRLRGGSFHAAGLFCLRSRRFHTARFSRFRGDRFRTAGLARFRGGRHIFCRFLQKRLCRCLRENIFCQRLEALRLRNAGARLPLRAVRTVQIVHRHLRPGALNRRTEIFRQFSLLFDGGQNLLLFLLERAQARQLLGEVPQLLIIQRAGCFLAVPRDKRNRVALIDELHRGLHLAAPDLQFLCDCSNNIHTDFYTPCRAFCCTAPFRSRTTCAGQMCF